MKYVNPIGKTGTRVPYVDADPANGIEGDPVASDAWEHPMLEIEEVIVAAGLTPSSNDLDQLSKAITLIIGANTPTSSPSYDNAHEFTVDVSTNYLSVGNEQGFNANDKVYVKSSSVLPSPLSDNAYYYVVNLTATTFKLSAAPSGAAIDISSAGSGKHSIHKAPGFPIVRTNKVETVAGNEAISTDSLIKGVAKAFVRFNGTGVPAIYGSHNVASITDLGTGNYQINFSSPMANSNYSAYTEGKETLSANPADSRVEAYEYATTHIKVFCSDGTNVAKDMVSINVGIFGDLA
jgi:hypothetical protein